jgi:Grx4 family monothiol glutaredoxin
MSSITDITSPPPKDSKAVLFFWAPWHEASCPGGNLHQALQVLQSSIPALIFARVEAEACSELSEFYGVSVVPTVVLFNHGKLVERVEGEDVAAVTAAVQRLAAAESNNVDTTTPLPVAPQKESTKDRLERLIRSSDVMLFMKGTPSEPRCGFSRQVVELLEEEQIAFGSFDILSDDEIRQGLKTHSNWPTYPQLYVRGELVGGLDILKELKEEGPLKNQLEITAPTITQSLDDRLKELVNRQHVMLFMKGLPSAPKCGFSRQMVELLDEKQVAYDAFNILEDDEIRQGLKKYSDWPTYPQLYVNGELVGGLDICKEMAESGDLDDLLKA